MVDPKPVTGKIEGLVKLAGPLDGEGLKVRKPRRKIESGTSLSDEAKAHFLSRRFDRLRNRGLTADFLTPLTDGLGVVRVAPGDRAVGVIYNSGALSFADSSALFNYIVMPPNIGGDARTWVYLTGTNRAHFGVEAFLSYEQDNAPNFVICDWARVTTNPWVVSIPYDALAEYIVQLQLGGEILDSIYVCNKTRRIGPNSWCNEVYLRFADKLTYALVYRYAYTITDGTRQSDESHFWGPIVETFQVYNEATNLVGFAEACIKQDGAFQWLNPSNSHARTDDSRFQMMRIRDFDTYLARVPE